MNGDITLTDFCTPLNCVLLPSPICAGVPRSTCTVVTVMESDGFRELGSRASFLHHLRDELVKQLKKRAICIAEETDRNATGVDTIRNWMDQDCDWFHKAERVVLDGDQPTPAEIAFAQAIDSCLDDLWHQVRSILDFGDELAEISRLKPRHSEDEAGRVFGLLLRAHDPGRQSSLEYEGRFRSAAAKVHEAIERLEKIDCLPPESHHNLPK